ncbi:MAG: hypothetical protein NC090_01020 [Anaeroplasma bactoclasticum]|nr:hypothetical protein [Anaeroplasma bactoclasticum]
MLKAIHNYVVLQKKECKQEGKIYMPSTDSPVYVVLSVGENVSHIEVGQKVVLQEKPQLFQQGMKEYYIISAEYISAIVEYNYE